MTPTTCDKCRNLHRDYRSALGHLTLDTSGATVLEPHEKYDAAVRDAVIADERPLVKSAQDVRELVADMAELAQEQIRVILLSTRLAVMDVVTVYQGTIDTVLIRQAELFRPAIIQSAPSIILIHNHPSGDASPSAEDRAMTEQAIKAGEILQINVLDHVVIAHRGAVSLRESMPWEAAR